MKFPTSELAYIFRKGEMRRDILALLRYSAFLVAVIFFYAALFQVIMVQVEGQSHLWITAVYWTVVTMSTLGVGDVTFTSDAGRLFSLAVLVSGVVLLLVVLPFTFIRFFYAPWLEAQVRLRAPRRVPSSVRGHVIISRHDAVAASLIEKLRSGGIPYYVVEPDPAAAAHLSSEGISVITGELDSRTTYEGLQVQQARLLLANCEDTTNANITLTVREASRDVPIVGIVEHEDSTDILELSGCNHVLPLKVRLGEYLANRVSAGLGNANVIGTFTGLQVAEFSARDTPFAGLAVRETRLRERTGLNVVGVWHRGRLRPAFPQTPITSESIVVVVGTPAQLTGLDSLLETQPRSEAPTLVIGAGTVGSAATRALKRKGIVVHVLERDPQAQGRLMGVVADRVFVGDASDREALMNAGLADAPSVLLTTNDDAANVYLAVYCRRLKPDLRIVSRITHNRNLEAIHRAGADFALSYSSLGAEAVVSLIEGHELVILEEDVDLFSVKLPRSLENKTLAESGIGSRTGLRTLIDITLPTSPREKFVVPLTMERVGHERERVHLRRGNRHARWIRSRVELRLDPQPGGRPRGPDAVHDGLKCGERFPAPVRGDVAEEPMLDLVPLAGPGGKVADADAEACLIGELLEFQLPGAAAIAVAASRVGGNEHGLRVGVGALPHPLPPVANRGHREGGRVVIAPHAHPGLVAGHVVDAVGNRLPEGVGREIVHVHRFRRPLWLPFPPRILERTDQFLLLCVDGDDRLLAGKEPVRGRVNIRKLRVAVGVRGPFPTLPRRRQTVAQLPEEAAHTRRAHAPPLLGQCGGELRATLARPPQGRGRVPAHQRIDQRFEGRGEAGLRLVEAGASRPGAAQACARGDAAGQLPAPVPNGLPRQAGRRRHQGIAAIPDGHRLGRRPPAATAFVQHRRHRGIFFDQGGFKFHVSLHADMTPKRFTDGKFI